MKLEDKIQQKRAMEEWLSNEENILNPNYKARVMAYLKYKRALDLQMKVIEKSPNITPQIESIIKEERTRFFPDAVMVEKWYHYDIINSAEYNWYMDILESQLKNISASVVKKH